MGARMLVFVWDVAEGLVGEDTAKRNGAKASQRAKYRDGNELAISSFVDLSPYSLCCPPMVPKASLGSRYRSSSSVCTITQDSHHQHTGWQPRQEATKPWCAAPVNTPGVQLLFMYFLVNSLLFFRGEMFIDSKLLIKCRGLTQSVSTPP